MVFFKVTDKDHSIKDMLSNTVVVCFVKTDNRPQMESLIPSPTLPDWELQFLSFQKWNLIPANRESIDQHWSSSLPDRHLLSLKKVTLQ